jgi:hypothetical protein
MDLLYFTGNWWDGERQALLAVEVENNWKEIRGTLRDLLQFQAAVKVAVFYSADIERAKRDIVEAATSVRDSFLSAGYTEAPSTAYLVIIGPDQWPVLPAAQAPALWAFSFSGLRNMDAGVWLQPA